MAWVSVRPCNNICTCHGWADIPEQPICGVLFIGRVECRVPARHVEGYTDSDSALQAGHGSNVQLIKEGGL